MLVALDDVTFCKELLGHVSCEVCKPDLCVVKNIPEVRREKVASHLQVINIKKASFYYKLN